MQDNVNTAFREMILAQEVAAFSKRHQAKGIELV